MKDAIVDKSGPVTPLDRAEYPGGWQWTVGQADSLAINSNSCHILYERCKPSSVALVPFTLPPNTGSEQKKICRGNVGNLLHTNAGHPKLHVFMPRVANHMPLIRTTFYSTNISMCQGYTWTGLGNFMAIWVTRVEPRVIKFGLRCNFHEICPVRIKGLNTWDGLKRENTDEGSLCYQSRFTAIYMDSRDTFQRSIPCLIACLQICIMLSRSKPLNKCSHKLVASILLWK